MKIGYVGLGAMGSVLARWLITDHDVTVWDLNPKAIETFVAAGAKAAPSLPELARTVDVIFLCLPRSSDVETAIFSDAGLIGGLSEGKIIVDQTSGIAIQTKGFAERLAEIGVAMLDAPVAGGVPAAKAGTITIMASDPDAAMQTVRPAFEAMTSKIYRASNGVGDAQAVKTLNNMMNMVMRATTLEQAALAVKAGVALPDLQHALMAGIGGNFTTKTVLPSIIDGRSTGDFALTLMLKDNNQSLALGIETGVPMPLSALARGVLQQNINIIGPKAGLDEVIVYMEQTASQRFADASGDLSLEVSATIIETVQVALAACNRAICYEIMSVAAQLGMKLDAFGEIVNNGSAWSCECETILAELGQCTANNRTFGEAIAALRTIETLSIANGHPL